MIMPFLKFYLKEIKLFNNAFETKLCGEDIRFISKKICRHFKIDNCNVFIGRVRTGHASRYGIRIPRKSNFGVLAHEIAHVWYYRKYYAMKHDKKLMKLIGRIIRYCEKKNYWKSELKRRHRPKEKKVLTKEEIREKKIEKTREKIKRYERRIKLYTTKLKKARRSLMMLERYKNLQR